MTYPRITYSLCVFVTLVIQHLKRMRRITLPSVACLAAPSFSHYLIYDTIFEERNKLLNVN